MNAIRQFIEVKDHSFNVTLPDDFDAKNIEIIIIPVKNKQKLSKETQSLLDDRLKDYMVNSDKVFPFSETIQKIRKELL